jgi:hypothetical protein
MFDLHDNNSTPNHAYGGCTALYVSQNGLTGFGTNGFQASDITNFNSGLVTTANFANLFSQYRSVPRFELQQMGYSDPTNGSTPCPTQSNGTGSFISLVPFAQQRGANILEVYANDAGFAYITDWTKVPAIGSACSQTNWQAINSQATFNLYGGGAGVNNPYSLVLNAFGH